MVHKDCVQDDYFTYWMAQWDEAVVTKYYCTDRGMYLYDDDFDDLVEEWIDDNFDDKEYRGISDDELKAIAESKINAYNWTDAIMVYIRDI